MTILDEIAALPFINLIPIVGAVCDRCGYQEHRLPAEQVVNYCRVHGSACRHCATGILHPAAHTTHGDQP